ncbi:MAG: alginate export family protein [Deltaproteobacteria bacterium]|nr:alginate export family protein [Deltaproteobacteria bacterium]
MKINIRTLLRLTSLLLLVGVCGLPSQSVAEGGSDKDRSCLTFGAGMRYRYEFQHNFNQKFYGGNPGAGKANDGFLLGRFRAGLDWYPTNKIHIALWGQHSEAWDMALRESAFYKGNFKSEHNPNKDRWELYTTYIEVVGLFDQSLTLKAGRQLIHYGDKRVFGPGQWGNTGRWIWDAVKLSWRFDRGFVDLFFGQTMLHDVRRFSLNHRHGFASLGLVAHVDVLQGPWALGLEPMLFTKYDKHHTYSGEKTDFYLDSDANRVTVKKTGQLDSWYGGARLYGRIPGGLDFSGTFLQEQGDFAHDDLRAYGYHVMIGYKLRAPWKPRLSIAYSYASGDSNPGDGDHETFQGAFGARDKMYGRMNLFHWRNLRDLEAGLSMQPVKGLKVQLAFHKFLLAERKDGWYLNSKAYRDKTGCSGDDVGRELDFTAKYKLSCSHMLMAGVGHFWPDEFAKKTASSKQASWFFMQWEYTFNTSLMKP